MRSPLVLLSICSICLTSTSFAQNSNGDQKTEHTPDTVRGVAIDVADSAAQSGDFAKSCDFYRIAYGIRSSGGLAHDIAQCESRLGHFDMALDMASRCVRDIDARGVKEDLRRKRAACGKLAEDMERKLATIVLGIDSKPDGLLVLVNGDRVSPGMIHVKPGIAKIRVTAPSYRVWEEEHVSKAGETISLNIRIEKEPAPAAVPAPDRGAKSRSSEEQNMKSGDGTPFQVSLFSPVALPPTNAESVEGIRLNLIYGMAHHVAGIDLGLVNRTEAYTHGVAVGLANWTDGDLYGIALSASVNVARDGRLHGVAVAPFNYGDVDMRGISIGAINVLSSVHGLAVGGLANISSSVRGLAVGGAMNLVNCEKIRQECGFYGLGLSGMLSSYQNLRGVAVSGILPVAIIGATGATWFSVFVAGMTAAFSPLNLLESARGVGVGAYTVARGGAAGAFFGVVNFATSDTAPALRGTQMGVVNYASSVEGLQLGVVNYAGQLHGLQLGLVNIARKDAMLPFFPIFNVGY
jgi:hypothetical protein